MLQSQTGNQCRVLIPIYYFDSRSYASELLSKTEKQIVERAAPGKIRCRLCGAVVTNVDQSINHNGDHIHEASNPEGYHFRFACFKKAPGCVSVGKAISEYSWFHGYSWQISMCRSCDEHLGWLFSGENRFYGLITNKLTEEDDLST